MESIGIIQYLIVCPFVFLSGFVDAIAGGGGLISLPAYLMIGLPSHTAIATNKLSSAMGTTISTVKYARNGYVNWKSGIFCIIFALCGSWTGASIALLIPENVFSIVMIVLLPFIAFYVLKNKSFETDKEPYSERKTLILCVVIAFAIGMYDGFYGPGTGTFLLIFLTAVARIPLNEAAGTTKIINLTSNATALAVFLINGKSMILLGITAGLFSIAGNYIGARLFTKNGAKIARPITIGVITLLFIKIIVELITGRAG